MHAVDPERIKARAEWATPHEIVENLGSLQTSKWVTLSGGDPVIWDLTPVVKLLRRDNKYYVAVETEGAMWRDWLLRCELVTLSPKGPSSGMLDKLDHQILKRYAVTQGYGTSLIVMKIVVFDLEDLMFARNMFQTYPIFKPYLSVGTPLSQPYNSTRFEICNRMRWLFEEVLKYDDLLGVTILPQLHTLAWGNQKGV